MGREETRSAVKERGATALTIRGRAWPFLGWGGFGRQGGGGPVVDSGKYLPSTRSSREGRNMPPVEAVSSFLLLLFLISPISTPTPPLFPTASNTIPSSSPNPTLLPKPRLRNPRETRTGHTLKFPSNLRSNPNGRHTCDRHAANLLRFVHGLIGFRDRGISFRCTTCTECGRYTILYYNIPHSYTYTYGGTLNSTQLIHSYV